MSEDNESKRDPAGKFISGAANPTGNNGHTKGWQRYGTRAKYWLNKLSAQELKELATDPERFGKLSSIDAIVVRHLVNSLVGEDIRNERKDLIDRIEGQATVKVAGDDELPDVKVKFTLSFGGPVGNDEHRISTTESVSETE